jgi:hypothetical protein
VSTEIDCIEENPSAFDRGALAHRQAVKCCLVDGDEASDLRERRRGIMPRDEIVAGKDAGTCGNRAMAIAWSECGCHG